MVYGIIRTLCWSIQASKVTTIVRGEKVTEVHQVVAEESQELKDFKALVFRTATEHAEEADCSDYRREVRKILSVLDIKDPDKGPWEEWFRSLPKGCYNLEGTNYYFIHVDEDDPGMAWVATEVYDPRYHSRNVAHEDMFNYIKNLSHHPSQLVPVNVEGERPEMPE